MEHRFIIGIGSQRAGSTLLHHLLMESTDIFMHPVKELHFFDTKSGLRSQEALWKYSLKSLYREVDNIIGRDNFKFINTFYKCYIRTNKILGLRKIEDVDYQDLFRPFLLENRLLGEITPEYMLLDDNSIETMKQTIGNNAGIVLLCRNPVKRFTSAVKLMYSYNGEKMTNEAANTFISKLLNDESDWLKIQDMFNDYERTIKLFSNHFKHFIAISYDDLISQPELAAANISAALDIAINIDIFKKETGKVKNDLGEGISLSKQNQASLEERYKKNQDYLDAYFSTKVVR